MSASIQTILEYLPLISIVISTLTLLFLSYQAVLATQQTRNNSTSTIASLYSQIAGHMLDIDKTFVAHPELRPYFYRNRALPPAGKSADYERCMAVAETLLDFLDLVIVLQEISCSYKTSHIFQHHIEEWNDYFIEIYRTSPALRRCFKEHQSWYSQHLIDFLNGDETNGEA